MTLVTVVRGSNSRADRLMARRLSPGRRVAKEAYERGYRAEIMPYSGQSVNGESYSDAAPFHPGAQG